LAMEKNPKLLERHLRDGTGENYIQRFVPKNTKRLMGITMEVCSNCGENNGKLKHCSQCGAVKYCSKECQIFHWKNSHKDECKK